MPLEPPNLDDRRFNDLFEEMKSLIPRYAPEWTDHNLSDPGISMLQLFAWLGDIIIYRLNRVPDRNYIEFLRLIGVELKPATPARAEVTFTLSSLDRRAVVIPKGARIVAEAPPLPTGIGAGPMLQPEPEEPIIFETDEPLVAMGAMLKGVQGFDGVNYVNYSSANAVVGEYYPAFGRRAREGSALLLGFASNNAFPTDQLSLSLRVYQDPALLEPHLCALPGTGTPPPATIAWEYWNGRQWRNLSVLKDETRSLTASGYLYFQGPKAITKDTLGIVRDESLYWLRCRLVRSQYERPPQIEMVLTNTVRATAVVTVQGEVLGGSNGQPNQQFRLRRSPVYAQAMRPVDERLQEQQTTGVLTTEVERQAFDQRLQERELRKGFLLEVLEGRDSRPWEEVENFYNSGPDDRHYWLNRTTGEIQFGNGEQGRIPIAGINNVIIRYYRYGGGARTNVGAGTLTNLQTPVAGVKSETMNYWPASGGADEESVEDAKARAPKELKARDRAVTSQDFEFLARQTPGVRVRRAHALPLYHPQFPGVEVPGVVTVIVVPEVDETVNWPPMPSESTLKAVCAYLNQRRLLTTEVIVAPPKYVQVAVEATVILHGAADPAEVKTKVEAALNRFLHPLSGGEDGQGWPLGGTVFYSEVFQQMLRVEGVDRVEELRLIMDGERMGRCDNAEIARDFLVYPTNHELNVLF
jgi:predicted phage baseplate assembly protein